MKGTGRSRKKEDVTKYSRLLKHDASWNDRLEAIEWHIVSEV